jgi:hypothetical protein
MWETVYKQEIQDSLQCNNEKMKQEIAHTRGGCNLRRTLKQFLRDDLNGSYRYKILYSRGAILEVVRCARIDGFLLPNVNNSYQQPYVRMQ